VLFNTGSLLVLSNNNALGTGNAIVAPQGTLGVNTGVTITNNFTLQNGGMIAGYGTFAPAAPENLLIENGTTIAGGGGTSGMFSNGVLKPIPGTLTLSATATLLIGPNGIVQFSMDNSSGIAGTDYSAINTAGTLELNTTGSLNPVTIQLISVADSGNRQAGVATFNNTLAASWVLISSAGITGTFEPNAYIVDSTTLGQGSFSGGIFNVTESGNDLMLNFTPVPEPSTWAMMGSGILALGAAVRRRRRR
ncbi:MAG TPA: PEP-CTERM sorting domain-containing protein, partial [Opitutaceae bacterium]